MEELKVFIKNVDLVTPVKETQLPRIVELGDIPYLSKYANDTELATREIIEPMLKSSFSASRLSEDAMPCFIAEIINSGMTRKRFVDAVHHCMVNVQYPKLYDFLNYDKADETKRCYTSKQMYEICQKYMCRYHDMEESVNVYNSTNLYNHYRDKFFCKVGKYFMLTEDGEKCRQELEQLEGLSSSDIKYIGEQGK